MLAAVILPECSTEMHPVAHEATGSHHVDMSSHPTGLATPPYIRVVAAPPHSRVEDAAALVTGAVLASFGLFLLHAAGAVTGGTAGLSLLLGYAVPVPFGVVYAAVSVPLLLLAVRRKGWGFTARSVAAVVLVAALAPLHADAFGVTTVPPMYGVLVGNLAAGLGMLVLFRHQSSLGGFNVVALVAQERRGWRAGYVQMVLDGLVVASSVLTAPARTVLYSAVGVVVVNLVLAMNHRPGRYLDT